jgi:hypothetical protein
MEQISVELVHAGMRPRWRDGERVTKLAIVRRPYHSNTVAQCTPAQHQSSSPPRQDRNSIFRIRELFFTQLESSLKLANEPSRHSGCPVLAPSVLRLALKRVRFLPLSLTHAECLTSAAFDPTRT